MCGGGWGEGALDSCASQVSFIVYCVSSVLGLVCLGGCLSMVSLVLATVSSILRPMLCSVVMETGGVCWSEGRDRQAIFRFVFDKLK